MDNLIRRETGETIALDDSAEGDVIVKRTKGNIIVALSLRAEQIPKFEKDLEDLCNHYLNMRDD